jgi:hypothetical protein
VSKARKGWEKASPVPKFLLIDDTYSNRPSRVYDGVAPTLMSGRGEIVKVMVVRRVARLEKEETRNYVE